MSTINFRVSCPRRSARLIAKKQSLESCARSTDSSHLQKSLSVDNKLNRARTLSKREEDSSEDSCGKRKKTVVATKTVADKNNCAESVKVSTSVDTTPLKGKKRTRLEPNCITLEENNSSRSFWEEEGERGRKFSKKSSELVKKGDSDQSVSSSEAEEPHNKHKSRKRKQVSTERELSQSKRNPRSQTRKEEGEVSVSSFSKKGKEKRRKKVELKRYCK